MKIKSETNRRVARRRAVSLLAAGMLAFPLVTQASTYTWSGVNPTGYFGFANNWVENSIPPTSGADLVFGSIHSNSAPFANVSYGVNSITFNASAFSFTNSQNLEGAALTVGAGGITDNAANAEAISNAVVLGTSQTWNVTNGPLILSNDTLTNSSSSVLTKTGTGYLQLGLSTSTVSGIGALSLQGGTTQISSGSLAVSSSTTSGFSIQNSAALSISGGAVVNVGSTRSDDVVIDSGGSMLVTGAGTQLTLPLSVNRIDIGFNSTGSMTVSNGATVNCQQPVIGHNSGSTGNLTVTGAGTTFNATGTLIVSGFNGTTGGNATLLVSNGAVLNAGTTEFFFSAGTINVSGGTINTGSLVSYQTGWGTVLLTNPTGGSALNINANSGTPTYSGSISGSGGINKTGGSTQILSGADSFTGAVLISGGELDFSQSNSFTTLNISSGAVARFNPGATVPSGTSIRLDGGTFVYGGATNSLQDNFNITANGGTVTVSNAATTLTDINALTGTGTLTVVGPGTLSLAQSTNSYGSLNISNGTLATVNLPTLSSLTLNGGTLAYSGTSTTLSSPINITANSGTFNIFPSTTTLTTTGALNASAATLTKTGAGTLDLALPGGYTVAALSLQGGTTQISSGSVSATSSVANPVIAVSNGAALVVSSGATVYTIISTDVSVQIDKNSSATVTGANSLLSADYDLSVGFNTPGTLTVSNGGSVSSDFYIEVGGPSGGSSGGTGTMTINSGGTVTSEIVDLSYLPGSTSNATVTGSGSTLTAMQSLSLGAGSSVLNISSGAAVNASATSFSSTTSTINISGGTLNTGSLNSSGTGFGSIILTDPSGGYALNINEANAAYSSTFSGIISGNGSLNKSGGSTQTLSGNNTFTGPVLVTGGTLNLTGSNKFTFANISGGTLSLGTTGSLASGANVNVYTGGTFAFTNAATTIGTVNLSGGTLLSSTNNADLQLNKIVVGAAGGAFNDITTSGQTDVYFSDPGPGITVTANSTWTVTNQAAIHSRNSGSVPINVSSGVTLTNGFGLLDASGYGFTIVGGGTLYQNSNPNQSPDESPVTVTQGTFRLTDASTFVAAAFGEKSYFGEFGAFPLTSLTLNGGTFSYGGVTGSTAGNINITASGGTINIESSTATLTDTGGISASGSLVKTGPGTLIVPVFSASNLTISSGKLGLSGSGAVLKLPSLTLGTPATLDIGADAVDFSSGSLSAVTSLVQQGYNGGLWTGIYITSSTAAADTRHLTAVGVIQNNQGGQPIYNSSHQFLGTTPGPSDILLAYTYYGDTNLDGKVDGSDYSRIDAAYLVDKSNPTALTGWFNGDFNYDGVVNGSDYTLIDNAFNQQSTQLSTEVASPTAQVASLVPEPAVGLLIVLGFAGLSRRRHF